MGGLVIGVDGKPRCAWSTSAPDYIAYHDDEWGRPVRDDDGLYERITLEAFQSGLSWLTILRKREGFRAAFAGFSIEAVARFGEADVARLLADDRIVRNRAKIEAAIINARAAADLPEGLATLVWSFAPQPRPRWPALTQVPSVTSESKALSKEAEAARFPVRRPHHGVRHDAGGGNGRRSRGRVPRPAPVGMI
jgi:DNA-3-methyladenine glycosylase I